MLVLHNRPPTGGVHSDAALGTSAEALEQASALVESFSSLEARAGRVASALGEDPVQYTTAERVKSLLQQVKQTLADAPREKIPPELSTRIVGLAQKLRTLQREFSAQFDPYSRQSAAQAAADTFKTPGDLWGEQRGMHAATADRLFKIFKVTQNYRPISRGEVDLNLETSPDWKTKQRQ